MKIGYIARYGHDRFKFFEAEATRTISSRGDKVRSKILRTPVDYSEIKTNADIMKEHPQIILVCEPFLLDNELSRRCTNWVDWANKAKPHEYDPFAETE